MTRVLGIIALAAFAVAVVAVAPGGSKDSPVQAQERPPNDDFAGYRLVSLPVSPLGAGGFDYTDTVNTTGATTEPGEPECTPGDGASVWYVFYPPHTTEYTLDTSGSDFATTAAVYRITDFVPSPPGGSLEDVVCTGGAGSQAVTSFPGVVGNGYAIRIAGFGGETGNMQLRIGCVTACPAYNDDLGFAPQLFEVPFRDQLNTLAATTQPGEPLDCGNVGRSVWYRINVLDIGTGHRVSISTAGSDFDTVVAIYRLDFSASPSPPGSFQLVQCADGGNASFVTENFTDYLIQVGGRDGAGGNLSVEMICELHPTPCPFYFPAVPDTGGGQGGGGEPVPTSGGTIAPPNTGSGGYR